MCSRWTNSQKELLLSLRRLLQQLLKVLSPLSVAVETGRAAQALVLPLQALQGARVGSLQAQVLLLVDGKATAQPVQVGLRTLEAAEVTQGLKAGDTVLLPPATADQRVRAQLQLQGGAD